VDKKPHVPLTGCWWVAVPSANNENQLQFDELSADGFICPSSVLKLLMLQLASLLTCSYFINQKENTKIDMFPNPYISLAAAQHWR
jgi:hypothetical protein